MVGSILKSLYDVASASLSQHETSSVDSVEVAESVECNHGLTNLIEKNTEEIRNELKDINDRINAIEHQLDSIQDILVEFNRKGEE